MSLSRPTILGCLLFLVAEAGCSPAPAVRPGPPPIPLAPAPVTIAPERKDVVFRYFDPASGETRSATSVEAIPEAARREVVVFDPNVRDVPGWDQVADLTKGLPAATHPVHDFAFVAVRVAGHAGGGSAGAGGAGLAPRADLVPDTPPGTAPHEIIMFSTSGCGYCAKARRFFADHQIPFSEYDLDNNPGAPQKLSELGRKAGLGPRELQGVPIFFIDGRPILGWDRQQIASILGV